jgi:hypothetical protein
MFCAEINQSTEKLTNPQSSSNIEVSNKKKKRQE